MSWRANENAPEIIACDAIVAAAVAMAISGYSATDGASWKKGCETLGSREISAA
jgi:hypothetical protein